MSNRALARLLLSAAVLAVMLVLLTPPRLVERAQAQPRPKMADHEVRLDTLEVGVGTITAWFKDTAGAATLAQINAAGYAVCDGTDTSEVAGALIATTPDLNGGTGRFLKGHSSSTGTLQSSSLQAHDHALPHDHPPANSAASGLPAHGHTTRSNDGAHGHPTIEMQNYAPARMYGQFCPTVVIGNGGDSKAIRGTPNSPNPEEVRTNGGVPHNHAPLPYVDGGDHSHPFNPSFSGSSGLTGGAETRPVNVSAVWIMRVK